MDIGKQIKKYRKIAKLTQEQLAEKANMSRSYIADIERDRYNPSVDTLKAIADALGVKTSQLLNEESSDAPYYSLTDKDERDIAKQLERIMKELESDGAMAFMGEPMDEEGRELLRISLENTLRISREMAKKKFTPKKYRN